ncbi:MAG: amidase [Acetobacteraceae bacterium]|nr:amidase [Acetobacteraceae bacterium]
MLANGDTVGAFVPGPLARLAPLSAGRLSGLTFTVEDAIDIAGAVTTRGNPDWARTHGPSPATAPSITALLQAGAALVGKTKTVELAYGLIGKNPWHGMPSNPSAPGRLPGGAAAGSAAAVAAKLVDFALGTDTAGSVRVPASYCGLFAIRPSFGALSMAGVRSLAPSLDSVGWFSRRATQLLEVGAVLLTGERAELTGPLLRLEEAWIGAQFGVAEALRPALEKLERLRGRAIGLRLLPEGVDALYDHFRILQAEEVWATIGPWVERTKPQMGPELTERLEAARCADPAAAGAARAFRRMLQARILPLLAGGALLIAPTSPFPAPPAGAGPEELSTVLQATIGVAGLGTLCGLPEVTLPAAAVDGAPVGLSLIAAPGRDRALLAFACDAAAMLGLPL